MSSAKKSSLGLPLVFQALLRKVNMLINILLKFYKLTIMPFSRVKHECKLTWTFASKPGIRNLWTSRSRQILPLALTCDPISQENHLYSLDRSQQIQPLPLFRCASGQGKSPVHTQQKEPATPQAETPCPLTTPTHPPHWLRSRIALSSREHFQKYLHAT